MNRGTPGIPTTEAQHLHQASARRPVVFGELLYDSFPDGSRVLGGAPFNVAWHLAGLGLDPLLVSRVGDDEAGRRALAEMERWGLDRSGVQLDTEHATGEVQVTLEDGEPEFTIAPGQAWDFIDGAAAKRALAGVVPALLYHGTLAARQECSAAALRALRGAIPERFVDLNLRAPWWSDETVAAAVAETSWLKLNRDELDQLAPDLAELADEKAAEELRARHGAAGVVLTLGAGGAVIAAHETFSASPKLADAAPDGDPVGAGDAFAAACIAGLRWQLPLGEILEGAMTLAGRLCRVRGALLEDRRFYREVFGERK